MSDPRPHHYEYAHRGLPSVIGQRPDQAIRILAGPDAGLFLTDVWAMAAERVPPEQRLPPDGLSHHLRWLPTGRALVVIELPPAERANEAHMVAVADVGTEPDAVALRVFTLELGADFMTGEPITFLCEWREGTHVNFGNGPAVDVDAFAAAVTQRCAPPATT